MKHGAATFLITLASALLLFFGTGPAARADLLQSLNGGGGAGGGTLALYLVPAAPGPDETVSASIANYSTDLSRADVSWYLDGSLMKEGTGAKTFIFKTGRLGAPMTLLVIVKTFEGAILQHSETIRPAAVDLVWEAGGYTPPFYEGKTLYATGGTVRVIALPQMIDDTGAVLDPRTLVYTWKENSRVVDGASGYGKQVFSFTNTIPLRPTTVSVDVSSLDGTLDGSAELTLSPGQPALALYEDDPLQGILYNKALSAAALRNASINLAAVPYFINAASPSDPRLVWNWTLNGAPLAGQTGPVVAFAEPAGAAGTAAVGVGVSSTEEIYQTASANVSLTFGGGQSSENPFTQAASQ